MVSGSSARGWEATRPAAARWPGMLHSCSHRTLDTDWAGSNVYLSGYKASPRISKQQRAPPLCFTAMPKGERSRQGRTVTPSPRLFAAMTLLSHSQGWSQP